MTDHGPKPYVVNIEDATLENTYAVEVGRSIAGGALDGAWIRLGFHDGVTGDQLAATVRSCALEA